MNVDADGGWRATAVLALIWLGRQIDRLVIWLARPRCDTCDQPLNYGQWIERHGTVDGEMVYHDGCCPDPDCLLEPTVDPVHLALCGGCGELYAPHPSEPVQFLCRDCREATSG